MQHFTIPGSLPSLNEYIKAIASNRHVGGKMKEEADYIVELYSKKAKLKPVKGKCSMQFLWICKNKKKDKDNVAFAKKFILDGLQKAGILEQDTWNMITGFSDIFLLDKNNPRIEVIIEESGY